MKYYLAGFVLVALSSWAVAQYAQYGPPGVSYGTPSGGYSSGGYSGSRSRVPVGGDVRNNNVSCTVDLAWFGSHTKWYLPFWGNFYRLRTASELLDLSEETIYAEQGDLPRSTCLVFEGSQVSGLGKSLTYDIQGSATDIKFKAPTTYGKQGTFKFSITDNEDYVVGLSTWEDGSTSWAVLTHRPYLDSRKRQQILYGIRMFGFDERSAYDDNYQGCDV